MNKFDDFDLDIKKIKANSEEELNTKVATTLLTCTMPGVCDTTLVTIATCDNTCMGCGSTRGEECTANTCSACHSYCGSACRR